MQADFRFSLIFGFKRKLKIRLNPKYEVKLLLRTRWRCMYVPVRHNVLLCSRARDRRQLTERSWVRGQQGSTPGRVGTFARFLQGM